MTISLRDRKRSRQALSTVQVSEALTDRIDRSKRPVNTMSTSKSRHEFQAEGIKLQKANMAADTEARLARQEKEKQRLREISEKNRRSNR